MVNVERCHEVAAFAEEYPELHSQSTYFAQAYEGWSMGQLRDFLAAGGTLPGKLCLGGMAMLKYGPAEAKVNAYGWLDIPGKSDIDPEKLAAEILGLSVTTWATISEEGAIGQASAIFYCFHEATSLARLRYVTENPAASVSEIREAVPVPDFEPGTENQG